MIETKLKPYFWGQISFTSEPISFDLVYFFIFEFFARKSLKSIRVLKVKVFKGFIDIFYLFK